MKKKERGKVGAVMNSWGKYGIIRETDMWNKRPEFTAWLLEVKLVNLEHLANWEEKQMFEQFMEDHSTASFPLKTHVCLPGGGCSVLVVKNGNFTRNTGLIEVHACIIGVNLRDGMLYVILGLCQQRRVLFTAHHYSVQHSSVAVLGGGGRPLEQAPTRAVVDAVGTTWHPCNNKQDVKSDKGKDKSGASDDNSHGRLLSALNSSGYIQFPQQSAGIFSS
ncbi:unnamed protein product [Malus baccata var. baccata]